MRFALQETVGLFYITTKEVTMDIPEKEKDKLLIGVWTEALDKSESPEIIEVLNRCDYVYSLSDEGSIESLKRRVFSSKIKVFPEFLNNSESAFKWLTEEHGDEKFTFVSPEAMVELAGMDKQVQKNVEDYTAEIEKRIPSNVKSAVDNLKFEVWQMNEDRTEILKKYAEACQDQEIEQAQAGQELELYIKKGVPAAELLSPVDICQPLRDGLEGMDDFNPWKED